MYPDGELNELAVYKAILRRRISRRREDCAVAATGALRPLAWLDRAIVFGKSARSPNSPSSPWACC